MQTDLAQLLKQLTEAPETIEFKQTIDFIESYYQYSPTQFTNGLGDNLIINEAGTNEGSCKIFAFAHLNQLSETQTLHCFGHYYRDDVLQHPDNDNHANIRHFMQSGWAGIQFSEFPLAKK